MSLEVITQLLVSDKAKDTYPTISVTGVTYELIPTKIYTQRKAITVSLWIYLRKLNGAALKGKN